MKPYEGSEQNDAAILGCAFGRDSFSLTLNHYNAWRLGAVVRGGEWHALHARFPVTLEFIGVDALIVVRQGEVGDYRIMRASRQGLSSALLDLIGLRCVGESGESRLFMIEANGSRMVRSADGWYAGEYTILLRCRATRVKENLRQTWTEAIGAASLPLLNALREQGPVQNWGVPDFERFAQEMS